MIHLLRKSQSANAIGQVPRGDGMFSLAQFRNLSAICFSKTSSPENIKNMCSFRGIAILCKPGYPDSKLRPTPYSTQFIQN